MAKERRVFYLLKRAAVDATGTAGVLDMLRYDAAKVECNPPDGYYLLSSAAPGAPCAGRWASFGLRVVMVDTDQYRLAQWARSAKAEEAGSGDKG